MDDVAISSKRGSTNTGLGYDLIGVFDETRHFIHDQMTSKATWCEGAVRAFLEWLSKLDDKRECYIRDPIPLLKRVCLKGMDRSQIQFLSCHVLKMFQRNRPHDAQ